MHIGPPDRLVRATPPTSRRNRRRRVVLAWMVAGSLLLHLALLAVVWLLRAHGAPSQTIAADSDVAVVFQSAGDKQAATASPNPAPTASTAVGNPAVQQAPPTPTPSTEAPTSQPVPPAPQPAPPTPQQEASLQLPQPPQPETPPPAPTPPPPAPTPPAPAPPTPAPPAQPPPASPPQPTPAPQASTQPPTVSLDPSDEGEMPLVPQFTMPPSPPRPLPPLTVPTPKAPPSPPRPRAFTQQVPRSRSGFPMPQNWSLATGPSSLLAEHGTDLASRSRGSRFNSDYKHVAGADPGEDWAAELHRWASDHAYYPDGAAENNEEGVATIQATIDRYGKVLNVDLVEGSGSTLLDAAWLAEWRHAIVPRFPPGTPEDSTTILYTIHYILVRR